MSVGPSEITGFVLSCTNAGWLKSLIATAQERLSHVEAEGRRKQADRNVPPEHTRQRRVGVRPKE